MTELLLDIQEVVELGNPTSYPSLSVLAEGEAKGKEMDNEVNKQIVPTGVKVAVDVAFGAAMIGANLTCGGYAVYVNIVLLGLKPVVSAAIEDYYENKLEKAT